MLSESTRRQMWSPVTLNDGRSYPYGFGWMFVDLNGHRLVHHPGGMPGARDRHRPIRRRWLDYHPHMNLDDVDINAIVAGVAKLHLPARVPANSR